MASKNYSYPRVTMSTVAKKHSHNRVNVPDTTILFAPLWTEKGPDDQVVKVHSLSEFIDVFGSLNEDFYNYNGQQALNVYNWLNNGGTLLVKRLVMPGEVKAQNLKSADNESDNWIISSITMNTEAGYYDYNISSEEFKQHVFTGKLQGILNLSDVTVLNGHLDLSNVKTKTSLDDVEDEIILMPVFNNDNETYDIYLFNSNELTIFGDRNTEEVIKIDGYDYIYNENEKVYQRQNDEDPKILSREELLKNLPDDTFYNNGIIYKMQSIDKKPRVGSISIINVQNIVSSKYHGNYYNGIKIFLEFVAKNNDQIYFNIFVKKDNVILEKFMQRTLKNYLTALSNSEYIYADDLSGFINALSETHKQEEIILTINRKENYTYRKTLDSVLSFYINTSKKNESGILSNHLETPIDIILDAGYPLDIKNAMCNFIRNNAPDTSLRTDIFAIFDNVVLSDDLKLKTPVIQELATAESNSFSAGATNYSLYEQYYTVNDATFTGQNVYVTSTYFLSKLIPYNDNTYGMQYPTAGLRRGILDDALFVNNNPHAEQKDTWFNSRINYSEKSSREYAFMSQRTHDGSTDYDYTALSFMNNSRVLEKMKKELEAIGRSYLHEFNDAVTIANMTVALNKYVSNWISNRTLSMGIVDVAQDEISENALDINLTIKFTNTIEVINVSIVIE